MLVDAHAHLSANSLKNFVDLLGSSVSNLTVISNSVDIESSIRNIALGKRTERIVPFIGIHPEIFQNPAVEADFSERSVVSRVESLKELLPYCSGIGEIGMDPKYGSLKDQEKMFTSILALCEKTRLPSSIHNRGAASKILELLNTYSLKGPILFHWFAGSEQELMQINDRGYYVSYGPSILYSKRMQKLVEKTVSNRIVPETDSPTPYSSLAPGISTPFLISTVAFKMSLIMKVNFDQMNEILHANVLRYLGTQNS